MTGKDSSSHKSPVEPTAEPLRDVDHPAIVADEAGENEHETDSAVGDDFTSSTASMTSTILQYRAIHGRTYHAEHGDAQYWASNDGQNSESLDIGHHYKTLLRDGKLFIAPLEKGSTQRVLDVGTGTGIWAIDFADEHPNAEVIGTDISPIQPTWVPPNLKFEIEDCTQPWTFPPDSFDLVHVNYLFGSIADWSSLFKEAYKAVKPGGWVESMECSCRIKSDDGTVSDTSAMHQWGNFFIEGGLKMGRSFTIVEDHVQESCMRDAGFVDIQVTNQKVPVGGWPKDPKLKEIGQYVQLALEQDFEGYILFLASQFLGWTKEQVTVYCAQLRREIRSGKHHGYYLQRVVIGRKPGA